MAGKLLSTGTAGRLVRTGPAWAEGAGGVTVLGEAAVPAKWCLWLLHVNAKCLCLLRVNLEFVVDFCVFVCHHRYILVCAMADRL